MAPEAFATAAPLQGPKRILVVGGGGRENALAWALARCPGVEQVWVARRIDIARHWKAAHPYKP